MTATVVRVSPEWLALREPADAAARSAELVERLARHLPAAGRLVVHDLGGGDGAMGRWLAPRLRGPQHWVVHDRDADLLERAAAAPPAAAPPSRPGSPTSPGWRRAISPARASSSPRRCSTSWRRTSWPDARRVHRRRVPDAARADGRRSRRPSARRSPWTRASAAAFNAHQRRLLGPDAAAAAVDELRGTGAEVLVAPSPWRLDAADADLTPSGSRAGSRAACEQEPALAAEAGAYRERRLAQAAAGGLAVRVGHVDLLVLP